MIPRSGLSRRTAFDGGTNPQSGARMGDAIQTPNSNSVAAVPSLRRINSRSEKGELSIDFRELLAGVLFCLIPLCASLIVLLSAFIYALLIS